jgi:hypothetical protein
VIYFPRESDTDATLADKELAEISKTDAVFLRIPFTEDREKSPWLSDSAIPTSKILGDNPSRDYNVTVGKLTIIVTDSYGNEYTRLAKQPKADELKGYIKKVKENTDKMSEKLRKNLDKANEALAAKDRKGALKLLLKNFSEGVVGLAAQEESIRAYHEILDAGRTEMARLTEKGDAAALKALAKDFAKTDLEKEIDEAIKGLK